MLKLKLLTYLKLNRINHRKQFKQLLFINQPQRQLHYIVHNLNNIVFYKSTGICSVFFFKKKFKFYKKTKKNIFPILIFLQYFFFKKLTNIKYIIIKNLKVLISYALKKILTTWKLNINSCVIKQTYNTVFKKKKSLKRKVCNKLNII